MDFDIGNILYVVITLIAVIVGLLGRKKKKAQGSGSVEEGAESGDGFMESIERVLRMGQEDPVVMELQDDEADIPEETTTESDDQLKKPAFSEDYEMMLERLQNRGSEDFLSESSITTEPLELILLEDEQETGYFEIIEEFDARTAVVYSAIINRIDY
jgi:hypothetical protein